MAASRKSEDPPPPPPAIDPFSATIVWIIAIFAQATKHINHAVTYGLTSLAIMQCVLFKLVSSDFASNRVGLLLSAAALTIGALLGSKVDRQIEDERKQALETKRQLQLEAKKQAPDEKNRQRKPAHLDGAPNKRQQLTASVDVSPKQDIHLEQEEENDTSEKKKMRVRPHKSEEQIEETERERGEEQSEEKGELDKKEK